MRRSFWNAMAVGAAAGAILGLMAMQRRKRGNPLENTKAVVGRTARRVLKSAQGTIDSVAGRFSD